MLPAAIAAALAIVAAAAYRRQRAMATETGNDDAAIDQTEEPSMLEELTATAEVALNTITGAAAASMTTSARGLASLKSFERCSLTPYRLGDGGSTIGWGRFYKDGGPAAPAQIDQATADQWFAEDVRDKAEKWVKAYVTVPITQPQFDALVHMAFNLSPKSFRVIADAVNAGQDPEAAAMRFTLPGSKFEKGLIRRRQAELAMFNADPATYA